MIITFIIIITLGINIHLSITDLIEASSFDIICISCNKYTPIIVESIENIKDINIIAILIKNVFPL